MHRRRRKLFIIIGIILILAALGVGGYYAYHLYDTTITELRADVERLEGELADAQIEMDMVVCTSVTLKDGEPISENKLAYVEIPLSAATGAMYRDISDLEGLLSKIDIPEGTILTNTMVMEQELRADERELEVVLDEIPIGLEVGDYIDVRISFPLGMDYIGLTKKRVIGIYDNVLKLVVKEDDFHTYESMKTDKSYYLATKLYASKYIEAGLQDSASIYYPVTNDVLKTLILDPNIDTSGWEENMDARLELELAHSDSWIVTENGREKDPNWAGNRVEKAITITSSKTDIIRTFETAKTNYERLQAQKEREAELANN